MGEVPLSAVGFRFSIPSLPDLNGEECPSCGGSSAEAGDGVSDPSWPEEVWEKRPWADARLLWGVW